MIQYNRFLIVKKGIIVIISKDIDYKHRGKIMEKLKADLSKKIIEKNLSWEIDEKVEYIRISTKRGYLLLLYSDVKNKYVIAYIFKDERYKDIKDIDYINNDISLAREEYDEIPDVDKALEFMIPLAEFGDRDPSEFLSFTI